MLTGLLQNACLPAEAPHRGRETVHLPVAVVVYTLAMACSSVEQYYRCTTSWCAKEATTLDAFKLIKDDGNFHCDVCDAVMEGIDQPGGSGMEQAQTRAAAQKLQVHRCVHAHVVMHYHDVLLWAMLHQPLCHCAQKH